MKDKVTEAVVQWQPWKTVPLDRAIYATRRVGRKQFGPPSNIFQWDAERYWWMQLVGDGWHRALFAPTHWAEVPAALSSSKQGNGDG